MTDFLEENHFIDITPATAEALCQGKDCTYDPKKNIFTMQLWNSRFEIDCNQKQITARTPAQTHDYFVIFIIHYLRCTAVGETIGTWISEKDFPGGVTFFRGPHQIPTNLISNRFGNNSDAFAMVCQKLGGQQLAMGDQAYAFDIAPGIKVALVYWLGDDEFPPEATLLYDQNLQHRYPLDVIFSLAVEICYRFDQI